MLVPMEWTDARRLSWGQSTINSIIPWLVDTGPYMHTHYHIIIIFRQNILQQFVFISAPNTRQNRINKAIHMDRVQSNSIVYVFMWEYVCVCVCTNQEFAHVTTIRACMWDSRTHIKETPACNQSLIQLDTTRCVRCTQCHK